MKTFDELVGYYSAEIRDEYLAEYEKLCFTTMKNEFLKL